MSGVDDTALPEISSVQRMRLRPGDLIVIECPMVLSHAQVEKLKEHLAPTFPGHKIVVLTAGMHLSMYMPRPAS